MNASGSIAAIVVAAGTGSRVGGTLKQYRLLGGQAVLARAIAALLASDKINFVLPIIHPDHAAHFAALALNDPRLLPAIPGGATRQASVRAGLEFLAGQPPKWVLIHDAARPFTDSLTIDGVLSSLQRHAAALPVLPVSSTIKRSRDGQFVANTEDRSQLFEAQTPQGFDFATILSAHRRAASVPQAFTDDAAIAEWAGLNVALVPGSARNIKLTNREDFVAAERLIEGDLRLETRVGTGFDVHPFTPGDGVWLGGVRIPHTHSLKGHSDADVALHALCDAIYGALGEGDIGAHFPPSEGRWKGVASSVFLKHAKDLVDARGGRIVNLDLTIVCEAPRIGPHVASMKAAIAAICDIATGRVAIKATTSEQLGFTGRREGIVAMASASIELPRED